MKICGIIAEYNPLHNGHLYQIEQVKKEFDAVVVIMSGNFVQRGLPSVWDKWTRAKYAIDNGVDLIFELPCDFAVASAERFAFGGVYILNSLNLIDSICFGAESQLTELKKTAEELENIIISEPTSVPFHELRNLHVTNSDIINKPNNILAIEYLKALNRLKSKITPFCIKRQGAGYNDEKPKEGFASATYLRSILSHKDCEKYMPMPLPDSKTVSPEDFYQVLRYKILSDDISDIGEIREGIENRIKECAFSCNTFEELLSSVKTKRYTRTSISRMLMQILLDIKKENMSKEPQYARLLGSNQKGREILSIMKERSNIPIITKGSCGKIYPEFSLDVNAGDIYSLVSGTALRQDFLKNPYIK